MGWQGRQHPAVVAATLPPCPPAPSTRPPPSAQAYRLNTNVMELQDLLGLPAVCPACDSVHASQFDLLRHYADACPAAVLTCRYRGCQFCGERGAVAQHQATCPVGRARCDACAQFVDKALWASHTATGGAPRGRRRRARKQRQGLTAGATQRRCHHNTRATCAPPGPALPTSTACPLPHGAARGAASQDGTRTCSPLTNPLPPPGALSLPFRLRQAHGGVPAVQLQGAAG